MFWLLLLVLGQGECNDRSPGLSKCIEYSHGLDAGRPFTTCRAACYFGHRPDGGTHGTTVHAEVPGNDDLACKAKLEAQAAKGCKP